MRWLTACLVAAGISVFGLTAQEKLERRPSRPNILFLFADDMRADTIGAHGNRHIRTPTLDRLARRGVSFAAPTASAATVAPCAWPAARC